MTATFNLEGSYTHALGINVENMADGAADLQLELQNWHLNSAGIAHGGVLATLLDSACGAAVFSVLPGTQFAPTCTLSVSYLSAARAGTLSAQARVVKQGRRMLYCDATVFQGERLLASAQASFTVIERSDTTITGGQ